MPIDGKSTNTTLQLLQRQLFTNAHSMPSARGGGDHGHLALALVLSHVNYLARGGVLFVVPVHPGPPLKAADTAAVTAVPLCNNNDALANIMLYNSLCLALTAQILTAVNISFLCALEDPDFGFGDVTPCHS